MITGKFRLEIIENGPATRQAGPCTPPPPSLTEVEGVVKPKLYDSETVASIIYCCIFQDGKRMAWALQLKTLDACTHHTSLRDRPGQLPGVTQVGCMVVKLWVSVTVACLRMRSKQPGLYN